MRRRKHEAQTAPVEPETTEPEAEEFVHSSRQADLTALLAEYTARSDSLADVPQAFRSRSMGAKASESETLVHRRN